MMSHHGITRIHLSIVCTTGDDVAAYLCQPYERYFSVLDCWLMQQDVLAAPMFGKLRHC